MSRLLHRWFNLSPYKGAEYIATKNGEKFWVLWREHDEDIANFRIYYYRKPVGHVNVVDEDNEILCLADIFIKREFQRLGIGKKMMKLFLTRAKQRGYREVYGHIQPSDGNSLEYVQEWYSRQGFTVSGNQFLYKLH